jgi:hypothetical protein
MLEAKPVDHVPLMLMTMMFAARYPGQRYIDYERDFEHQAEAQIRTEAFGFDHVSVISGSAEALDCGSRVRYFEDQPFAIDEQQARLAKKADLATLKKPLPAGGPRMQNRLRAVSLRCTPPVGKFACTFAEMRAAFWETSPGWTVTSSTSIPRCRCPPRSNASKRRRC